MRPLSEQNILQIWEIAQHQHPIDRALTILALASPDTERVALADLSKGKRDTQLLAVREKIFGSRIFGLAQCEVCHEELEITFSVTDIQVESSQKQLSDEQTLNYKNYRIKFRLPNSHDLAELVACNDNKVAQRLLIQRCVFFVSRKGKRIAKTKLPKSIIRNLEEKMAALDPQALIKLDLKCNNCKHRWQLDFDILSFLWVEISACAKQLLSDVHNLARYYCWSEQEILTMSPTRRKIYLEMIN